jgi:outer membrane protein assembly factor BamB
MHGDTTPATRRRRGRRGARLAAVATLVLVASGCWPAPGQGPDRASYNPFETVITPRTVRTLAPVWTATTGSVDDGGTVGPPVVSNADVHVSNGTAVYTFDKATGAPRWREPESPVVPGAFADPVADGDRVLVSAGLQQGFGGAWVGFTGWYDARTGSFVEDGHTFSRVLTRRGPHLAGISAWGSPSSVRLVVLGVTDTADPSSNWSGILQVVGAAASVPRMTLGVQRLYEAGTVTDSFDPPVDTTGVRAYPVTPPATCVAPPPVVEQFGGIPCPLWVTPTDGQPVTSPVLGPGESALYVGLDDGTLLALDATDGHVLWTGALGAAPSAEPALAEGWLYVPLTDGDLAVLPADGCGAATCSPAWRAHLGGAGVQPAVAGGVVFVGTDAGRLVALRAAGCHHATCHPLWHRDFGAPITGAPAVTGGHVYVGVSPDQVVALAPRDG